ncbi:CDC27 domain-containing protein [Cephalotus follicularis]|uniref:DNA polymerase delta subunit 3 n=1 Tax=Cephalotus follicularis TaxID=3775 RepID=A0A1Q3AYB6_CEPFO|nr:CDC27 domain-containing protein [Cephalotus follicularis]
MSRIETLGLLEEIQALISDKLQVVSYKWLSRNFLVSSNVAKRLLQEFVENHGNDTEVVYSLSGWLKKNPSSYHVRLVSRSMLAEAKGDFDDNCSVQVYSVQACIPKDPAALWNTEFVQAEELFKQPSAVNNCLRDNRFCGISNSFVKRNAEQAPLSIAAPQSKSAGSAGLDKSNILHKNIAVSPPQQTKVQKASPTVSMQSSKSERNSTGTNSHASKPPVDKEIIPPVTANGNKRQNGKSSSEGGGSLANLWDRASAKSKPNCAPAENNKLSLNTTVSAEAQIRAREEIEGMSSDDDGQNANVKRASNGEGGRKRRVVFDYSDEEDEYGGAVNLASPDPPKGKLSPDSKQRTETLLLEKKNLIFDKQKEPEPEVKEVKAAKIETQPPKEELSVVSKGMKPKMASLEKIQRSNLEKDANKEDSVTNAAPTSPKRRKVLKTRIDERGREVTEVVWEGEETEIKKADSHSTEIAERNAATNIVNRPLVAKKTRAVGNTALTNATGKAVNRKAGNKDPKQGNILSFFKQV